MSLFKTLRARLAREVESCKLQQEIVPSLSFTQPGTSGEFDEPRLKNAC